MQSNASPFDTVSLKYDVAAGDTGLYVEKILKYFDVKFIHYHLREK